MSTLFGCAAGGVTVLFVWKLHPSGGVWSLSRIINGCLAGILLVIQKPEVETYTWYFLFRNGGRLRGLRRLLPVGGLFDFRCRRTDLHLGLLALGPAAN